MSPKVTQTLELKSDYEVEKYEEGTHSIIDVPVCPAPEVEEINILLKTSHKVFFSAGPSCSSRCGMFIYRHPRLYKRSCADDDGGRRTNLFVSLLNK